MMLGTWINMGTVLAGGLLGWALGERFPDGMRRAATASVGIVTLILGFKMALEGKQLLVLLLAVILGGILGTALGLSRRLEAGSRRMQELFRGYPVAQGFLTASLLFCVGPLSLLGAIRDGLFGDWSLLGAKAMLDGISAVALTAALGPGVLLSLGVILVYQGGVTLAARFLGSGIATGSPPLDAFSAAGGAVIIALGLELLELKRIPAVDLLPALLLAPLLSWVFAPLHLP